MKISFRKGLVCLLLAPSAVALAQEYTLTDALSGTKIPLLMKPSEIPEDYKAVKLTGTGGGGLSDTFGLGSMYPLILAMGNNQMPPAEAMLVQIWPITWTKGDVVRMVGQDYVVAYGLDLAPNVLKGMDGNKKLPPFSLKLKLIKTTEMGSITPLPEWSKERYLRAMAQVVEEPRVAARTKPVTIIKPQTESIPKAPIAENITTAIPQPSINTTTPNDVKSVSTTAIKTTPGVNPGESTTTTTLTTTPGNTTTTGVVAENQTPSTETAVKGATAARAADAALYKLAIDNAKSLASAMLLYAQDYDGVFPYVQSTRGAEYVLYPYVKGTTIYKTQNPMRAGDFRFNMALAGVSMSQVTNAAEVPLFYDPSPWPDGTYLVSFADSHARFMTADQWSLSKRYLQIKLKKTGTPLPATLGLPNSDTSLAGH